MYQPEALQTILAFVIGCLNEDEQIARDAGFSPQAKARQREWAAQPTQWPGGEHPFLDGVKVTDRAGVATLIANGESRALHAARHDPAAVLDDIAAKRSIVILHGNYDTDPCLKLDDGAAWDPQLYRPCLTLRYVARGYARRPGFLQEWSSQADSLSWALWSTTE